MRNIAHLRLGLATLGMVRFAVARFRRAEEWSGKVGQGTVRRGADFIGEASLRLDGLRSGLLRHVVLWSGERWSGESVASPGGVWSGLEQRRVLWPAVASPGRVLNGGARSATACLGSQSGEFWTGEVEHGLVSLGWVWCGPFLSMISGLVRSARVRSCALWSGLLRQGAVRRSLVRWCIACPGWVRNGAVGLVMVRSFFSKQTHLACRGRACCGAAVSGRQGYGAARASFSQSNQTGQGVVVPAAARRGCAGLGCVWSSGVWRGEVALADACLGVSGQGQARFFIFNKRIF